jgi:hypothetical protein
MSGMINWKRWKLILGSAAMALGLAVSGVGLSITAEAQNRDWHDRNHDGNRNWNNGNWHRDDRNNRDWSRAREIERAREIARAREIQRQRDWQLSQRNRIYRTYPNGGGYYGGYGNNGYGNYGYGNPGYGGYSSYGSYDQQKGFNDGLTRGQEDARSGRIADPNNSSHYRNGNSLYREGFRQGYAQGYQQYGGYGRYGW